jgi:hypothetical protein
MRQLAWLDFYRGKWRLMTSDSRDRVRQWADEETALSDLAGECWTISGPYPKRLIAGQQSKQRLYGYALRRTVH